MWRKKQHYSHCTTLTMRKISYFWPLHFYESCHQRFLNKYPIQPPTDTIRPLQLSCLMCCLFGNRDMTHREVCIFVRWTNPAEKHLDWSSPITECINFNQTQTKSFLHSSVFYESINSRYPLIRSINGTGRTAPSSLLTPSYFNACHVSSVILDHSVPSLLVSFWVTCSFRSILIGRFVKHSGSSTSKSAQLVDSLDISSRYL